VFLLINTFIFQFITNLNLILTIATILLKILYVY